jgi:hypothetical protein
MDACGEGACLLSNVGSPASFTDTIVHATGPQLSLMVRLCLAIERVSDTLVRPDAPPVSDRPSSEPEAIDRSLDGAFGRSDTKGAGERAPRWCRARFVWPSSRARPISPHPAAVRRPISI